MVENISASFYFVQDQALHDYHVARIASAYNKLFSLNSFKYM